MKVPSSVQTTVRYLCKRQYGKAASNLSRTHGSAEKEHVKSLQQNIIKESRYGMIDVHCMNIQLNASPIEMQV